jgi:hypothetical protein
MDAVTDKLEGTALYMERDPNIVKSTTFFPYMAAKINRGRVSDPVSHFKRPTS